MNNKCICESMNSELKNTHYKKLPISIILHKDTDRYGLVVFYQNSCIGSFDVNYCPMCGKKLKED